MTRLTTKEVVNGKRERKAGTKSKDSICCHACFCFPGLCHSRGLVWCRSRERNYSTVADRSPRTVDREAQYYRRNEATEHTLSWGYADSQWGNGMEQHIW